MTDPLPQKPDGHVDQNLDPAILESGAPESSALDRSAQAARFLDLARMHALEPDESPELDPLIAARLQDGLSTFVDAFDGDDADNFGNGSGFAAGAAFGTDDTPLDPFD